MYRSPPHIITQSDTDMVEPITGRSFSPHCRSEANEEWRLRSLATNCRRQAGTFRNQTLPLSEVWMNNRFGCWEEGCHILRDFFLKFSNGYVSLGDWVQSSSKPQNLPLQRLPEVLWSSVFGLCMLIRWVKANVKRLIAQWGFRADCQLFTWGYYEAY